MFLADGARPGLHVVTGRSVLWSASGVMGCRLSLHRGTSGAPASSNPSCWTPAYHGNRHPSS